MLIIRYSPGAPKIEYRLTDSSRRRPVEVLQALPSLLQNYRSSLSSHILRATLEVCFLLYGSKAPVVSNTAAAVLQQLVTATFENASSEEGRSPLNQLEISH